MSESEECRHAFLAALELIKEQCSFTSGETGGNPDGVVLKPGKVRSKMIWQPRIELDKELLTSFVVNCENDGCVLIPVINAQCKFPKEVFDELISQLQVLIQRGGKCEIDWGKPPIKTREPLGEIYVTKDGEDLSSCLMVELKSVLQEKLVV